MLCPRRQLAYPSKFISVQTDWFSSEVQEPVMMSAGWSRGTDIARHEYKGLSKMAYALEDWAEKNRQTALEINRRSRLRGRRHSFFHETSD